MKNILLGGIFIAGLGLLGASFVIPTFAHEPSGGEATLTNQEVWEYMQEACYKYTSQQNILHYNILSRV